MSYDAEIAFEIRAPEGRGPEAFDQALAAYWRDTDQPCPEVLAAVQELCSNADRSDDDGTAVLRYFEPSYKLDSETAVALDLLCDVFPEADAFSGTYRLNGEDMGHMELSYWGDDDRIFEAIEWTQSLHPQWLHYGVHISAFEIAKLAGRPGLLPREVDALCRAVRPEIERLIGERGPLALDKFAIREHGGSAL